MASDSAREEPRRRGQGHIPVMPKETLELLQCLPGAVVVDCTAGGGGHLALFAEAVGNTGRVIGLDRDPRAHQPDAAGGVAARFLHVQLVRRAFSEVGAALAELGIGQVDALFADLGVSSFQLDEGERGFSFRADAPLDMRMDPTTGESAADLIARLPEGELADVIYRFGDEHRSRRIARAIKRAVPTTTKALADVVAAAVGGVRGRIHPATKSFQALRIAVNGELSELEALLDAVVTVLKPGGRVGMLTFHSLEDRLVKNRFRSGGFQRVTKKAVQASDEEVAHNPRARSARLRVAIVTPHVDDDASEHDANEHDDDIDGDIDGDATAKGG